MGKKKFTDQAFLFAVKSFKEERRKLIDDALEKSAESADLYEGLYENKNVALRKIEFERYELLVLKRHWEDAIAQIEHLPETEYYAHLKLFLNAYRSYTVSISEPMPSLNFIDAKLEGLEQLMLTNKSWEDGVKRIKVEILRNKKVLDDKIALLKDSAE